MEKSMNFEQPIKEMLAIQAQLNDATNGKDWRLGKTELSKVIDWKRCIYMETAELIDSYPWKHWKAVDAKTDIENVRVELVDIWHFLLSLSLEHLSLEDSAELMLEIAQTSEALQNDSVQGLSVIEQVQVHEKMMLLALQLSEVTPVYLQTLTKAFFNACAVAELSFTKLYEIYMAKNVLNQFRQDNGYKEGHYIKIWNGKEDNVVMFEIIANLTQFSGDALYKELKAHYQRR